MIRQSQKKVLLAHPGTQHAPRLAMELYAAGVLDRFATGIAFAKNSALCRLEEKLRGSLSVPWSNRVLESIPSSKIHRFASLELRALWRLRSGEIPEKVLYERNATFQNGIPDQWIDEATHVVGFDTSSWLIAERCRITNRPFVLVQTIGHPATKERLYVNVRKRFPEWSETISPKPQAYLDCELVEHTNASAIIAPSSFVRETLVENGVPRERIHVIPFGADLEKFRPSHRPPPFPMKFLYAGAITARKGIPVLLQAWKRAALGSCAELWLAGSGHIPESVEVPVGVRLFGALSQSQLAALMRRAHFFCFSESVRGARKSSTGSARDWITFDRDHLKWR